ncbi:MAG: ribosome maturation factor RimP [Nannocystaceae bacterium]
MTQSADIRGDTPADTLERPIPGDAEGSAAVLLEQLLEPVAAPLGYEIVAIDVLGRGRGRIVRFYLDAAEGITLDDCTRMGRVISAALDAAEADPETSASARALLADPYTLEVSSPGLERPLTKRSHFLRFTGERAVVRTRGPLAGMSGEAARQRTFHGVIVGVTGGDDERDGVVALRALEGEAVYAIPIPAIRRANLVPNLEYGE